MEAVSPAELEDEVLKRLTYIENSVAEIRKHESDLVKSSRYASALNTSYMYSAVYDEITCLRHIILTRRDNEQLREIASYGT